MKRKIPAATVALQTLCMTLGLSLIGSNLCHAIGNNPSSKIGPNTTIVFAEKTTTLTQDSVNQLNVLINEARASGEIKEVQVAVWSDNPAPHKGDQLSKADRILAEKRVKAITKFFKKSSNLPITTHNMAERPSFFAKILATADAEIKNEIGRHDELPMSKEEYQVFKNNGQPSKAVALVIMKTSNLEQK